MHRTIVAKQNQSMPDIILQSLGSMEAGMEFCALNNVSISDLPEVGTVYQIPETSLSESNITHALRQNEIVIGTHGHAALYPLSMTVLLRPVFFSTYAGGYAADAIGYYHIALNPTIDFINVHSLVDTYPGDNEFSYQEATPIISGGVPATVADIHSLPMPARHVAYHIPWTSPDDVWVWDNRPGLKTATFEDVEGNRACVSPVIVCLDHVPLFHEYMIAKLLVEFVSTDGYMAKLRLTRSHTNTTTRLNIVPPYGHKNMSWVTGLFVPYEDPDNIGDPDVQLIDLPPGKHTLGVETEYVNDVIPFTWPAHSICTQVIEIS